MKVGIARNARKGSTRIKTPVGKIPVRKPILGVFCWREAKSGRFLVLLWQGMMENYSHNNIEGE